MLKLIILTGPSGSGKTTLRDKLIEYNPKLFKTIKTYTTRPPRPSDKEGDYEYITDSEFQLMVVRGEFIEHQEVYDGCKYGTTYNELINKTEMDYYYILCIDVMGALTYKNKKMNILKPITFFCNTDDFELIKQRLIKRDGNLDINKRLEKYNMEMKHKLLFDYIVNTNCDISQSVSYIINKLNLEDHKLNNKFIEWFKKTTTSITVFTTSYIYKTSILNTLTSDLNKDVKIESIYNYLDFIGTIFNKVNFNYDIKVCDGTLYIDLIVKSSDPNFDIKYTKIFKLKDNNDIIFNEIFETYYYKILNEKERKQLNELFKGKYGTDK